MAERQKDDLQTIVNKTVHRKQQRATLALLNKRQRIPKGQSEIDNPEKLATQGTQDQRIPKVAIKN